MDNVNSADSANDPRRTSSPRRRRREEGGVGVVVAVPAVGIVHALRILDIVRILVALRKFGTLD